MPASRSETPCSDVKDGLVMKGPTAFAFASDSGMYFEMELLNSGGRKPQTPRTFRHLITKLTALE